MDRGGNEADLVNVGLGFLTDLIARNCGCSPLNDFVGAVGIVSVRLQTLDEKKSTGNAGSLGNSGSSGAEEKFPPTVLTSIDEDHEPSRRIAASGKAPKARCKRGCLQLLVRT